MKRLTLFFYLFIGFLSDCSSKSNNEQREAAQNEVKNEKKEQDDEKKEQNDKKKEVKPSATNQQVGMQALVDAYSRSTQMKLKILKKDLVNGYMEFEFSDLMKYDIPNQFGYFLTTDGKEILAMTMPHCTTPCTTSLVFYEMVDNQLMKNEGMIENFSDMHAFYKTIREYFINSEDQKRLEGGYMDPFDQLIVLPQIGTTIQCIKRSKGKEQKIAELQFNEKMGKFKLIKL